MAAMATIATIATMATIEIIAIILVVYGDPPGIMNTEQNPGLGRIVARNRKPCPDRLIPPRNDIRLLSGYPILNKFNNSNWTGYESRNSYCWTKH
jgi:hypothetical protein